MTTTQDPHDEPSLSARTHLALRREMHDRFGPSQVGVCADGAVVHLMTPVDAGLLDVGTPLDSGDLSVTSARVQPMLRTLTGTGVVLGTIATDGFTRRHQVRSFGERLVRPATPGELATIAAGLDSGAASFRIGALREAPELPAQLVAKGFARHTFMCGQSGSDSAVWAIDIVD